MNVTGDEATVARDPHAVAGGKLRSTRCEIKFLLHQATIISLSTIRAHLLPFQFRTDANMEQLGVLLEAPHTINNCAKRASATSPVFYSEPGCQSTHSKQCTCQIMQRIGLDPSLRRSNRYAQPGVSRTLTMDK